MGELPSKYSSRGLSAAEQKRVITTGTPKLNRPIGAIKIQERVEDAVSHESVHKRLQLGETADEDWEGDIPMVGMDDEEEVQIITDYVTDKRETDLQMMRHTPPVDFDEDLDDVPVLPQLSRDTYMVVDTNFMISHLDIVDKLAKLHKQFHHKIVIPVTVVKELDGLKESKKSSDGNIDGVTVGHLARWANDWTYGKLANSDPAVRGQKIREKLDRQSMKDDSILDCGLYLKEREDALVILLSNDKNLCMKALTNEIPTVSYRKSMTADLIANMAFNENKDRYRADPTSRSTTPIAMKPAEIGNEMEIDDVPSFEPTTPQPPIVATSPLSFSDATSQVFDEVQKVVLGAIDFCMYDEYEDDIELIGYHKSKVLTLKDASEVLIKYWVSVFTEYFSHSAFSPFVKRGKRSPQHVRVPIHVHELKEFVEYWGNVLRALYLKRDNIQNDALEKIIERWTMMASASYN